MLNDLCGYIRDEKIKTWVHKLLTIHNIKSTYSKAASSGGKYHPTYCNGDNGLYHHTKICMLAAERIISLYKNMKMITPLEEDVIYAALILHDAWKYTTKNDKSNPYYTTKEHGFMAYVYIKNAADKDFITTDFHEILEQIALLVRYHMSNWCHTIEETATAQSLIRESEENLLYRIVSEADLIASSRELLEYGKALEQRKVPDIVVYEEEMEMLPGVKEALVKDKETPDSTFVPLMSKVREELF